jgi:hypothetical protein
MKQKYFKKVLQVLFISTMFLFCSETISAIQNLDWIVQMNEKNRNAIQSLKIAYTVESILRYSSDKKEQASVQCM